MINVVHCSYDSNFQFHPTGRILQVENAKEAVNRGGPIIGMKCTDGILLVACRKDKFPVLHLNRLKKLFFVDDHICVAATGLLSDAGQVVEIAKYDSSKYRATYDDPIPIESLVADISSILHQLTRAGNARPIGAGKFPTDFIKI